VTLDVSRPHLGVGVDSLGYSFVRNASRPRSFAKIKYQFRS
jgi:hypothetical protein